jgi:alpha-galactosidase
VRFGKQQREIKVQSLISLSSLLTTAIIALQALLMTAPCVAQDFGDWADTPPMGWNSWDSYGSSVVESEVRANAQYMSDNLKQFGWEYVVVDIRWYVNNPGSNGYTPFNETQFNYNTDGIMTPSPNRFTSANDGTFTQLASDIHNMDLKFGLHMMRGINRRFYDSVNKNENIGNTSYKFADLVTVSNGAAWLNDNYGLQQNAAAQAWYDLMIGTYASWGMDYIKVDDLSAPNYRTGEVDMLRNAIDKVFNETGHKVLLSTSPGATADIDNNFTLDPTIANHVQNNANLWRITNDLWDNWNDVHAMFERANQWTPYRREGNWPDNDMLPLGRLGIRAHVGGDRMSNLTHDEQRTLMSLWSITRSPLMFGGDLPSNDAFTLSLLNNPEVLAVNQKSSNNQQLFRTNDHVAWVADAPNGGKYLAVFNLNDPSESFDMLLSQASFVSGLITKSTPGRSTPINVDITGKDRLYLLVDDGDGPGPNPDVFDYDWANWVNMELQGPGGNISLTDLAWTSASSGWQGPEIGLNNEGNGPLRINGIQYEDGIGTHSVSVIEFELPAGYTTLVGLAGLDDGGANQPGSTSSVRFAVTATVGDPQTETIDVILADLGLSGDVLIRDVWSQSDLGIYQGEFSTDLSSHASGLYLLTPLNFADVDQDGDVDGRDFLIIQRTNPSLLPLWQQSYGLNTSQTPVIAIPEPSSEIALLILTGSVGPLSSYFVRTHGFAVPPFCFRGDR